MTSFIAHLHSDLRGTRYTRRGATHHPEDVPKGTHKEYARMEQLPLPEPAELECSLESALLARHSSVGSANDRPFSLQDFGTIFGLALRRRAGKINRNYPSGGTLFPIETYLFASALEGALPGVFHYNPTTHSLERLWGMPVETHVRNLVKGPESLSLSALIVFTSVWKRSSAKYGDFTYPLALLEAGHMSENILLISAALEFETRPMAGFDDDAVSRLLDLDGENEQPVHSITLCKSTSPVVARLSEPREDT